MRRQPSAREIHQEGIDRSSFEPAYVQLVNSLRRQISTGVYRPGDRLPSEVELAERYGVSLMTAHKAIGMLADERVVSTAQGRGTFVRQLELGTATFQF